MNMTTLLQMHAAGIKIRAGGPGSGRHPEYGGPAGETQEDQDKRVAAATHQEALDNGFVKHSEDDRQVYYRHPETKDKLTVTKDTGKFALRTKPYFSAPAGIKRGYGASELSKHIDNLEQYN